MREQLGAEWTAAIARRGPRADRIWIEQGHLLLTNPGLLNLTDDFFSPAPSSTTTAEAQTAAFQASPLPALLEAVLPAPAATNSPSTAGMSSAPYADIKPLIPPLATTSPADDRMSTGGWSPAAQSPPIASGSIPAPLSALSLSQRQVLGLPLASAFGRPLPSNGLQTLANAAATDSDYASPFRFDGVELSSELGRGQRSVEEERLGGEGRCVGEQRSRLCDAGLTLLDPADLVEQRCRCSPFRQSRCATSSSTSTSTRSCTRATPWSCVELSTLPSSSI